MPRPLITLLLGVGLAGTVTRVEDGQFTREYSRLYTAVVLSMGLGLVAAIALAVALARKRG